MSVVKGLLIWIYGSMILLAGKIISYPITPFAVAFADRKTGKLPKWFWWMETHDKPLPGAKSITGPILDRYGWWAASTCWLLRNNCYALANSLRVNPDFSTTKFRIHCGSVAVGDDPYYPGLFIGTMRWDGGWAFELRAVWPLTKDKCGTLRMGYKLSRWFVGKRPEQPTATGILQFPSLRPLQTKG